MTLYTENELWRIISIVNDLEVELMNEGEACNICDKVGPLHILVRNEGTSLLIFEKIISPTPNIPKYGKSPIEGNYSAEQVNECIDRAFMAFFNISEEDLK